MFSGVKIIAGGLAAIVLGCLLYAAPKDIGLKWYQPLPAFAVGLILIAMGVYTLRSSSKKSREPEGASADGGRQLSNPDEHHRAG
jgi:hypothetical protein